MAASRPYQPLLLRLLHGAIALLVLGAIITGYWAYSTYDRRFGAIALLPLPDIQGIHGTIGLTLLLLFPAFALYSFHAGQQRLIQPSSLSRLHWLRHPLGWISWHRLVNTLMLVACVLALISGRMMQESWLPAGEVDHLWYSLHLLSWAIVTGSLALHLLMGLKVGGVALLRSMFAWHVRPQDHSLRQLGQGWQWLQRRWRRS